MTAGKIIGWVALVLALISSVPSAAAFTSAVFLSLLALLISGVAAVLGQTSLSLVTFLVVVGTVLISPITTPAAIATEPRVIWILVLPFVLYVAALTWATFRKKFQ